MIIRFGIDLDGLLPDRPQSKLGYLTVGPNRFLSILETQLGLGAPSVSAAARLVQYRACLSELDTANRFYHQSFQIDELGVTRTLLNWRDVWYLAGWDGKISKNAGQRLNDMAAIETLARRKVAPSMGERQQAVLDVLKKRKTQVEKVQLVDEFDDIPHLWQDIISNFKVEELHIDKRRPGAKTGSDLLNLQKALWSLRNENRTKTPEVRMKGDGSVIVLKARSKAVSARLIAEYIKLKPQSKRPAVITGKSGLEFDEALISVDEPRCGFQKPSNWRPVLQIVPLALGLIWEPLDPSVLLQFLTHPVGPLPFRVRSRLASVVSEHPGIGGTPWQKALSKIMESEKEKRGADEDQLKALNEEISYWLQPPRFTTDLGAPVTLIAERCSKVGKWLGRLLGIEENPHQKALYASALRQAMDISQALDELSTQGVRKIDQQQLYRLLDQVYGSGGDIPDIYAECLHVLAADNPAAFINICDELVWWDFSMPNLTQPYPWTGKEVSVLAENNVQLQSLDTVLQYLAKTWLRPVLSACKRTIFVLHESDEAHHPLWDQITTCTGGWKELDVEIFLQQTKKFPLLSVTSTPIKHNPLPLFERWWHLKDGKLLSKRKRESYSSLETFIKSPYQWVLGHKAKLYAGSLTELSTGNQLKGTLIHRLFEDFFTKHNNWSSLQKNSISRWVNERLKRLIEEEGAVLLRPGKTMERELFQETGRRALLSLVRHMKEARIKDVKVENYEEARFTGGDLAGYMDMLLVDQEGREIVLDIKWGGLPYRAADLRNNNHLQLVIYSYLRKQRRKGRRWPEQAYFIIENARLLAQNNTIFPSALVFGTETGETAKDLWKKFEVTWQWRRKQMNNGIVEVTVTGTEADSESIPPEDGMTIEEHNDHFNDYSVLTGWGENA
ncbi:PD-(D/E)XK nuclease family protein [Thermodesulfobacteriota bacterium]